MDSTATPRPTSHRAAVKAVDPAFMKPLLRFPGGDLKPGLALRVARKLNSKPTSVHEGVTATARSIRAENALDVIVHEPAGRSRPSGVAIWLFGGGLITGSAAHVNDVASRFAAETGAMFVVPDYRVAPEHPFPAAIDDAFTTLQWIISEADSLGIDPDRIVVGGESAGAGIAAALAQRAADAGITLRLQLLIAPMLDDRTVIRAERDGRVALAWTVPSNRLGWSSYLGHDLSHAETRPYAVPARREDLSGLAQAWISIGDIDLFHDEARDYAARLTAAGVPCEFHTTPGAHHAFELFAPDHPRVKDLHTRRVEAIRLATHD